MSAPALANVDRSARLPVGETLAAVWREGRAGFGVYAQLVILPLSLSLLVRLAQAVLDPAGLFDPDRGMEARSGLEMLAHLVVEIVSLLALVPAFTAWHRYLILGPDHPAVRLRYSVGDEEWRYLNVALRLGGLYIVAVMIGQALMEEFVGDLDVFHIAAIVLWLPLARWLLLFPAAATGQPVEGRWRDWAAPGNAVRLWLVVALPEMVAWLGDLVLLGWLRDDEPQIGPAAVYALLGGGVEFAVAAFAVAALSIAYRQLALPQPEAAP